jgi:hypothetical protein
MGGPFELDEAKVAEYGQRYRDAVQPSVGEEVQAVGAFQRTGRYLLSVPVIGQIMLLFHLLHETIARRRGSLPMHFLLAVTPERVHAFKYRPHGSGRVKLEHEIAVWKRADVAVASAIEGSVSSTVTLDVRSGDLPQRIVCHTGRLSTNPWSARVLELLGSGAA